jgi:hypothetical protein
MPARLGWREPKPQVLRIRRFEWSAEGVESDLADTSRMSVDAAEQWPGNYDRHTS